MKYLLLVAHGSRREESNREIAELAARLAGIADDHFDEVLHAYLELAEPSIPEAIDASITAGATEVTVVPYFLSAGRHVSEDIPAIVSAKQAEYPDHSIRIAPYLGTAAELPELLLNLGHR